MAKRSTTRRDLVNGPRKFYAKRDARGRFKQMDRVDRSLAADRPKKAKRTVKAGQASGAWSSTVPPTREMAVSSRAAQ